MLIDTHSHLNHEQFEGDVDGAIERALSAGVERMIVIGFDIESSESAVNLADKFSSLFAVVGVHPHDAVTYDGATQGRTRELALHPRVVAIGEIGLDYHYELPPRDDQARVFRT